MTTRTAGTKAKARRPNPAAPRSHVGFWVLVGVGVFGGLMLIAALATRAPSDEDFRYGTVSLQGESLPAPDQSGNDSAVGTAAPEITSTDLDGKPITVTGDGRPKLVLFLAHWCPHCQREVPVVQDWIDQKGLPTDVDLVSVLTRNSPGSGNWPPDQWLADEGWTMPVAVDDKESEIATALGLSATPFWVAIDADGKVVERAAGEITTDEIERLIDAARNGAPDTTTP